MFCLENELSPSRRKTIWILSVLCTCWCWLGLAQTTSSSSPPEGIFQHWIHSYEEDERGFKVFRTAGYKDFPPSRGREGFKIDRNGDFIQFRIAPEDGLVSYSGEWKSPGPGRIEVVFEGAHGPLVFEIIELGKERLKILFLASDSD